MSRRPVDRPDLIVTSSGTPSSLLPARSPQTSSPPPADTGPLTGRPNVSQRTFAVRRHMPGVQQRGQPSRRPDKPPGAGWDAPVGWRRHDSGEAPNVWSSQCACARIERMDDAANAPGWMVILTREGLRNGPGAPSAQPPTVTRLSVPAAAATPIVARLSMPPRRSWPPRTSGGATPTTDPLGGATPRDRRDSSEVESPKTPQREAGRVLAALRAQRTDRRYEGIIPGCAGSGAPVARQAERG